MELLAAIPGSGDGATPQDLQRALFATGHEINTRTIQRDLLTLREQFPALECDDSSKPHRWRWSSTAAKSRRCRHEHPGGAQPGAGAASTCRPRLPASMLE